MIATAIITNGDEAVRGLARRFPDARFLPWRDVLHEGPVPAVGTLAELSSIRASFIAERGWAELAAVRRDFEDRDASFLTLLDVEGLLLAFETDLYDQLQLAQIGSLFAGYDDGGPTRHLLTVSGSLAAAAFDERLPEPERIDSRWIAAYEAAWTAFTGPTPRGLAAIIDEEIPPVLARAIGRLLEEFPHPRTGLGRTERTTLESISNGLRTPAELFTAVREAEEDPYLGDWSFWEMLGALAIGEPLVTTLGGAPLASPRQCSSTERFLEQRLIITDRGISALRGERPVRPLSERRRWIGGVELGPSSCWYWDPEERRFSQDSAA